MATCVSCGTNVTGKKFCPDCGTPVGAVTAGSSQSAASAVCPHCGGDVRPGVAFCSNCGTSLAPQAAQAARSAVSLTPPPPPAQIACPSCHVQVPADTTFCTQCGYDMRAGVSAAATGQGVCARCGQHNTAAMRFCGGCGSPLTAGGTTGTMQSGQYQQPSQYQPPSQYQQNPYGPQYQQGQYPGQYQQNPYGQPYQQGAYPAQYQQVPMVLRCPICQAMAAVGTPNCASCRTSLINVVPTPANVPIGQQGGLGGFMQGNGGKFAMGALGGAAAVIGGEVLLHGVENALEGDRGYRHHREEGLLGGLGELADDIGLI